MKQKWASLVARQVKTRNGTAFFNATITESDIKEAGQGALEIAMRTKMPKGQEAQSTLKSSRHGCFRSILWLAGIF